MNICIGPCSLLEVTLKVKTTNASPTDSQTTKKPQTNFEIGANCSKCQWPTDRQQSNWNVSQSTARIYSKRTLLPFTKIQVILLYTYKFFFLTLFCYFYFLNLIVCIRFFIARILSVLPETGGAAAPPFPLARMPMRREQASVWEVTGGEGSDYLSPCYRYSIVKK